MLFLFQGTISMFNTYIFSRITFWMLLVHLTGIDQFFFFSLFLLMLVIILQRLNFVPIFPFYFVVFTFVGKSWGKKKA